MQRSKRVGATYAEGASETMKRIAYLGWGVAALFMIYAALAFKAPEIERDVDQRAAEAVSSVANHPIAVETDGRGVAVSGYADTDAEREKIVDAVREVWGARGPDVVIEVLPRLAAYPFTVRVSDGAAPAISGAAPSVEQRDALAVLARKTFGSGASIDLELASGAPENWLERLTPGMEILSRLDRGVLEAAGETLSLSGATRSEAVLAAARAAAISAGEAQGMPWSLDLSLIKPRISPFVLEADKASSGAFAVSGYAPDADARQAITQATEDLALGVVSATELTLADGAPGPEWTGLAIRRMGALASLEQGRLAVSDFDARLNGRAADLDALFASEASLLAADASIGEAAGGATVFNIGLSPYRLEAATDGDRKLTLRGAAATPSDLGEIETLARDLFGQDSDIRLAIASGADDLWPDRAKAALTALAQLDRGELSMTDAEVVLTGVSRSESDLKKLGREIRGMQGDGAPWRTELVFEPPLLSPFPLDVVKLDGGGMEIAGAALDEKGRRDIGRAVRRLGGLASPSDVVLATGASEGWTERAIAAFPALKSVDAGRLEIRDDQIALIGDVATPEAAETAQAEIEALLGPEARIELTPREPRRASLLTLTLDQADTLTVSGRAPEGLPTDEVIALLGLGAASGDKVLETGGRGDAEKWRDGLRELGEFLPEFETLSVEIDEERASLDGSLVAASDERQVRRFLKDGFARAFDARLTVEPSGRVYGDGETRVSVLTGRDEVYRGGYWLPKVTVENPEDCARASELVLLTNTIRFIVGSAELDVRARKLVNELSSIASECLTAESPLALDIGGHTDSTGGSSYNMGLSEKRAQSVRDALIARGVSGDAMKATGYGETQPIGDNETEEGRTVNRRISFDWIDRNSLVEPAVGEAQGAEGAASE